MLYGRWDETRCFGRLDMNGVLVDDRSIDDPQTGDCWTDDESGEWTEEEEEEEGEEEVRDDQPVESDHGPSLGTLEGVPEHCEFMQRHEDLNDDTFRICPDQIVSPYQESVQEPDDGKPTHPRRNTREESARAQQLWEVVRVRLLGSFASGNKVFAQMRVVFK